MKVLVTGGSGFIGQHCLAQLRSKGYEVHVVSSKPPLRIAGLQWHQANLLDITQIKDLVYKVKPSHLLHLAWYTEHGKYWTSQENFKWVQASLTLLHEFTESGGQRFVVAGTCAEYDWSYDIYAESSTPCRPWTLYGAAKYSMEILLESWSRQTGLSSACGRIFLLYGPGESPSRLVPSVVNSLLLGEPALCTHGGQVRDFMYVADVAAGFIALLESDVRGPVNIASGEAVSLRDVVYTIADKLNRRDLVRLGYVSSNINEPAKMIADVGRLRDEVGFVPSFELEQGIALTIESMKKILQAS
jgi:nucleoside-diphosphate-sugar epimerase